MQSSHKPSSLAIWVVERYWTVLAGEGEVLDMETGGWGEVKAAGDARWESEVGRV